MTVQDLYEIEVNFELDKVKDFDLGTEEHRKAVADTVSLTDRLTRLKEVENEAQKIKIEEQRVEAEKQKAEIMKQIEEEKIELEKQRVEAEKAKAEMEKQKYEAEKARAEAEAKDRRINLWVTTGLGVAKILLVGTLGCWMMRFEETGSIVGKGSNKAIDSAFRLI